MVQEILYLIKISQKNNTDNSNYLSHKNKADNSTYSSHKNKADNSTYSSHCVDALSSVARTRKLRTNAPKLPDLALWIANDLHIAEVDSSSSLASELQIYVRTLL